MASQMGGFRGRMDGPRQGAWLLLCCCCYHHGCHALQGGSAVSGKVQRWSRPGPLGGCSALGRQGWRPVCMIWVCDHIWVWGPALLGQGRESASAGSRDAQSPGVLGRHAHHCVSWRVGLMRRAWEARGRGPWWCCTGHHRGLALRRGAEAQGTDLSKQDAMSEDA